MVLRRFKVVYPFGHNHQKEHKVKINKIKKSRQSYIASTKKLVLDCKAGFGYG